MTRTHEKDPRRYRATFGVRYPDDVLTYATKAELEKLKALDAGASKYRIENRKIVLSVTGADIPAITCYECNFHVSQGERPTSISSVTFSNSDFERCILGYILFERVVFERCTFTRCDFSRTEFRECTFRDCVFRECTAWEAVFVGTAVDPDAFLQGLPVPLFNYQDRTEDEKRDVRRKTTRALAALAEQLLRSNEDRRVPHFSDRALYHYKRTHIDLRLDELGRRQPLLRRVVGRLALFPSQVYHVTTGGGTSIGRLMLIGMIACGVTAGALYVKVLQVQYDGGTVSSGVESMFLAASLFLGFGFANFKACSTSAMVAIVVISSLGVAWIALVIAVLIRRVYR